MRIFKTALAAFVVVLLLIVVLAWALGGQGHLPFVYEGFDK